MNESQCTALDGSLIRLSGTEGQFTEPWTSSIVFREGRGLQHFGAGPIDLGERVAAQVMEIPSLDEAYTYQQGELSVGSTEQIDPTVTITRHVLGTIRAGVWRGRNYSLYTRLYDGTTTDLLAIMDHFTISETPTGIVLEPTNDQISVDRPARITQAIPGLGLLRSHRLTRQTMRTLPEWTGTQVAGGELFVENQGEFNQYFVLISATGLTTIQPFTAIAEVDFLAAVRDLTVEWEGPPSA